MKKIIFILALLTTYLNLSSQKLRDNVKVTTNIFEIEYSEKLEQPISVQYTVQCFNGTESRAGMDFYTNDSIHTSDNKDYVNNVWDKGHLAPAADFNCDKEKLYKTFSYLNCSLQNQYLNRGVWKILEGQEREWSKIDIVVVKIKLIFNNESVVLPTGATVPFAFEKSIYLLKSKKTYKFYFENIKPIKNVFWDYKIN